MFVSENHRSKPLFRGTHQQRIAFKSIARQPLCFPEMTWKDQPSSPAEFLENGFILLEHSDSCGHHKVSISSLRVFRKGLLRDGEFIERNAKASIHLPSQHFLQLALRARSSFESKDQRASSGSRQSN